MDTKKIYSGKGNKTQAMVGKIVSNKKKTSTGIVGKII